MSWSLCMYCKEELQFRLKLLLESHATGSKVCSSSKYYLMCISSGKNIYLKITVEQKIIEHIYLKSMSLQTASIPLSLHFGLGILYFPQC